MISTSRVFRAGPHSTGWPQRALMYLAKAVTSTGLFAGLVGGVFLGALVLEHVAQAGRQVQRALLAVQDRREAAQRRLVDEADALLGVAKVVGDVVGRQGDHEVLGNQRLVLHVEGLVIVDIGLVQRVPEVVVGRGDDLVEGRGAVVVAVQFEQRLEVVRRTASYMASLVMFLSVTLVILGAPRLMGLDRPSSGAVSGLSKHCQLKEPAGSN